MTNAPLDITDTVPSLAPCEHIAGNQKFILKALDLQRSFISACGTSLVDVTLDLEDGAPVHEEAELRNLCVRLINSDHNRYHQAGIRVHAPHSSHFEADLRAVAEECGETVSYITVPKVESYREAEWAISLYRTMCRSETAAKKPFHILIETPGAVKEVDRIAGLPQVQVLDFGLMDFISHVGGAIPSQCMRSPGQFDHNVLAKVKGDIVLAALTHGKVASHNVTVDFRNPVQAFDDALRARREFGFMRMWSIHPSQIPEIVRAMAPSDEEVSQAEKIIDAARTAAWGPIEVDGRLHDRASYRYFWSVLQRRTK